MSRCFDGLSLKIAMGDVRRQRSVRRALLTANAAQYLRQHPPGNTSTEHKNNAREASPICQARSATLRLCRRNWQKRFDQIPQRIRNERASHVKVPGNRMPELLPRCQAVLLQAVRLLDRQEADTRAQKRSPPGGRGDRANGNGSWAERRNRPIPLAGDEYRTGGFCRVAPYS